jgi:hypothetical protein
MFVYSISATAGDGTVHKSSRPHTGRYIVLLDNLAGGELEDYRFDIQKVANAKTIYSWNNIVRGFALDMTPQEADKVARLPFVRLIEEDGVVTIAAATARSWNMDRIDNTMSPRLDGLYAYCETGAGVFAYVVDTGVWAGHDEFTNQDPLATGQPRVRQGWDYMNARYPQTWPNLSNDPCPHSSSNYNGSHGTAVASVLGGRTLGAAPEVTIVPVRFLDCNAAGYTADLIAGLNWIPSDPNYLLALQTRAAAGRVVNMSHVTTAGMQADGTPADLTGIEAATQGLLDRGITVVAAAGNFNEEIGTKYVPARMPGIITVAGTKNTENDSRWNDGPAGNAGSNYGPVVDMFAPADRVLTAHWTTTTATRDPNDASISSGTSFASPLVAGIAARWLQNAPGLTCAEVSSYLVQNALTDVNTPGFAIADRQDSPNRLVHRGPLDGCRRRP